MVTQLRGLVSDIKEATDRLTTASGELTGIAEQGSDTITRQRQETDQVATAVNEMAATVQEVARSAAEAASATGEANHKTAEGQAVVQETKASVDGLAGEIRRSGEVISRLKDKSENIGSVLEVIRGIAEQTNLLALNAAIEAARAGEQGRGFAVVADEVRTLASRTQRSTQEIQEMIESLQEEAGEAVQVMEKSQSGSAAMVEQATRMEQGLGAIAELVGRINAMNTQIATAAEEQSTVAEMINSSVVSIAQDSEGTEQMTRQTAQAAGELNQLGEGLRALVHRFNA
jgi:methyl-accepting chemotaxis protein